MKRLIFIGAVATALVGCSSTGSKVASGSDNFYTKQVESRQERQARDVERTIDKAPKWMTEVPRSPGAVYANGTAVSDDYEMAVSKAKMHAYGKICMSAGGTVDQRSNVFRSESGDTSTGTSELAIRAVCRKVDITGVDPADKLVIAQGNRYRAYVLVALPIGEANQLRKNKVNEELQRDAVKRSRDVFKEMDREPGAPAPVETRPLSSNQVQTIDLLPVDNEAYKAKRDEALQKPGAVIGQMSVR